MKIIFTLSFIVAYILQIAGQTLNSARQPGMQTTYGMVSVGAKSFYLEKSTQVIFPNEGMDLVIINSAGTEVSRTLIYTGPWLVMTSLVVTEDACLLVK